VAGIEETLKQLGTVAGRLPGLTSKQQFVQAQNEIRTHVQEIETERNNLLNTINESRANFVDLQRKSEQLSQVNADLLKQVDQLKKEAAGSATPPPSAQVTPLQLAASFRDVVDQIQTEARSASGVATTIKSMDIEVKGFLQVQDDKTTVFAFPTARAQIDPNALSILRVSFGAVPAAGPEAFATRPTTDAAHSTPTASPGTPKTPSK